MRVLCAPDSFKGTVDADAAADAMTRGLTRDANHVVKVLPLSDGGEGFGSAILKAWPDAAPVIAEVCGPGGRATRTVCIYLANSLPGDQLPMAMDLQAPIGVIEFAMAGGIRWLRTHERDPMRTTSYGVGEMIHAALENGARTILLGLGGSATCDGGAGMVQALGGVFHRTDGSVIEPRITGGMLREIARVDLSAARARIRLWNEDQRPRDERAVMVAAYDVRNPLLGPRGAAPVFAPQKGASPEDVRELEAGLANLARTLGDDGEFVGAGAAGGAGYGAQVMLGAQLVSGVELVMTLLDFEKRVRETDLIITGEGRLDAQTREGKVVAGVLQIARKLGKPVIAIAGSVHAEEQHEPLDLEAEHIAIPPGELRHISLSERFGERKAMKDATACIERVCAEIAAKL